MSSLKKKAIKGTIWTLLAYSGSQGLRLASNLILTRLLVPELFGLMALINTFIRGLTLFSDVGIRPSIIRSSQGEDPTFLNTAWTLQVIRGSWLWIGTLLIAWPVSKFYNEPQLLWLIPLVGLGSFISGFNSTALATLNRKLQLGKLIVYDLIVQLLTLFIMIVWAWISPTIWALIGGTLAGSVFGLIRSHLLNTGAPNRFTWDKQSLQELFSFGRWIFVSTAMTFLASQADRLILGKLLPLEMLGIYTIAYSFSELPKQVSQKISGQVLFPAISQLATLKRDQLREKIAKKRWLLLLGLAVVVSVMVSFGDWIILKLYDDRYRQAAWMLPLLVLGFWPYLLSNTVGPALMALGKPFYAALGNVLKFFYMIIGLPLAYSKIGVLGAVLIVAFNDIPFYAGITYGVYRENLLLIKQDILATLLLLSLLAVILTSRYFWGFGFPLDQLL